jgi:UDP-N-acetylglucosamine 2-epimerase (hydrolysing)
MPPRNVLFVTGTRADFGKLKPLMKAITSHSDFTCSVFATGMHTLKRYGYTVNEVKKSGFDNVHVYMNQHVGDHMEMVLASTIAGLSRYVHEHSPDLLVIHGDRVEALAGAIVGALSNTLTCHIEGGERSGTVDELIRHAISKLAHLHFVSNDESASRLVQMGELSESVFVIGSPDIDAMMSGKLPSLAATKKRYEIDFESYGVLLFHPVTTDAANMPRHAREVVDAVLKSERDYVVIYPNNDAGSHAIFEQYERLVGHPRFRVFPSVAFEHFLTLMKHARFVLGNSSAGIREAPVYGVYSINVGDRQANRYTCASILNVGYGADEIVSAIDHACASTERVEPVLAFGLGDSADRFMRILEREEVWRTSRQKLFRDLPTGSVPPLVDSHQT